MSSFKVLRGHNLAHLGSDSIDGSIQHAKHKILSKNIAGSKRIIKVPGAVFDRSVSRATLG
jgi:hypothetical protein